MIHHSCGLFHCPMIEARRMMPELDPILNQLPETRSESDLVVDVKVHMLMPGQWPCVPNWHQDFIPRDEDNVKQPHLIDPTKRMWLWLSGPPLTEFRADGNVWQVKPRQWVSFNQLDEHRGTASEIHTWRTFIRVAPIELLKPAPVGQWIRRHTQVYLDAGEFTW